MLAKFRDQERSVRYLLYGPSIVRTGNVHVLYPARWTKGRHA